MAGPYTRVLLAGERRNADLLLPSDTPVGALMPQVLDLLDDHPREALGTKALVRADGAEVPPERTVAEAGVLDGERLRLVSRTEAPPAPIVYDLHDTVSDSTDAVRGRWSAAHRLLVCGTLAAAGSWLAVVGLLDRLAPAALAGACALLAAVLLVAGAALSAPGRRRAVAGTLVGAGALFAGTALVRLGLDAPWTAVGLGALAALVLGVAGFVVTRPLALFIAAAVTGALAATWAAAPAVAAWAVGDRDAAVGVGAAGIAGVVTLLVLGLLPAIALGASGLARLDDRQAAGGSVLRADARRALDAAHGGLVGGTIACAVSLAVAAWSIGSDTRAPAFSLPLLACLVVATALRARSFPLAAERIPLYLAAATGVLALARLAVATVPGAGTAVLAGLLVLALAVGAGLSAELPEHTRARLRRAGDALEALALFAAIPVLIGYAGIYASLLETFR
ncbi:type VII secretion integral membrane protein EccD [Citricoccus sp. SGAir0253]|uniref:type VII secretion integral membrane protein EccD n=1 Tax=Citricoccus sp. SGAir0253 TaxID=2567881 RepID=UPI0010CD31AF|nr:type VII secretion integral membrane protein EccD [Citricoccus sp. SGAir0253]QCU77407.1 type VII secretion integral membrane protein EccD [Citricoccus sp. SGAir0253]